MATLLSYSGDFLKDECVSDSPIHTVGSHAFFLLMYFAGKHVKSFTMLALSTLKELLLLPDVTFSGHDVKGSLRLHMEFHNYEPALHGKRHNLIWNILFISENYAVRFTVNIKNHTLGLFLEKISSHCKHRI